MSMKLFEMKADQAEAIRKAEDVMRPAEAANRAMTPQEASLFETHMQTARSLHTHIEAASNRSTLRGMVDRFGVNILSSAGQADAVPLSRPMVDTSISPETQTAEYVGALATFLGSGGKVHGASLKAGADGTGGYHIPGSERFTRQALANGLPRGMSAAMYEGVTGGSNGAGGYAVSVPTVPQIIPLAMPDLGIYNASMVIPTATDVKVPQQASFGTSTIKAESNGTIATFGGTDPTLSQVELTSFMAGGLRLVSWELLQDVDTFQQFVVDDLLRGQRILEGSLLATGTGVGQPQGVFGNTGTGTGTAYALTGTSADGQVLLDALFDVVAQLKATYQANASFIMTRATGLAIRRAQMQSNLFVPVFTMDADGTERILGKPVYYDVNAPALPSATTAGVPAILYGDFKAGFMVGVRGGAGINVKILDQPWAAQGMLGVLAYRRLDSRVSRSEAIQSVTFSHA